jgi:acyl carrier protein
MDATAIRQQIKTHISAITGIPVGQIADSASYADDLGLDSLSMLELSVNLEYTFKIKIPVERLPELRTIDDAVRMVQDYSDAARV